MTKRGAHHVKLACFLQQDHVLYCIDVHICVCVPLALGLCWDNDEESGKQSIFCKDLSSSLWYSLVVLTLSDENNVQPSFDARLVLYPTIAHLRDYLSWRQADTHVNNLYNTAFWALVGGGTSPQDAEMRLQRTTAGQKNEILFSEFGINYNNENPMFRKGSVIIRDPSDKKSTKHSRTSHESFEDVSNKESLTTRNGVSDNGQPSGLRILHEDIIRDNFWNDNPGILHPPDSNPPRMRI